MPRRFVTETRRLFGTVTGIEQVLSAEPLRQWASVECDLTTGVPLQVVLTSRSDSAIYLTHELAPGEKMVVSRFGDMRWDGSILLSGVGGTAGYRGGEVYWVEST